jgi:hypothetical protein
MVFNNTFVGCVMMATAFFIGGCDRIEGKTKDILNTSSNAIGATTRAAKRTLVSDMQERAEQLCIESFSGKTLNPEPSKFACFSRTGTFDVENHATDLIRVAVQGDGKYLLSIGAFRRRTSNTPSGCVSVFDDKQSTHEIGQYNGVCSVENGVLISSQLYAPGEGPAF